MTQTHEGQGEDTGRRCHLQAKDGGPRRNSLTHTLILDFQPPECVFISPACGALLGQLKQTDTKQETKIHRIPRPVLCKRISKDEQLVQGHVKP